MNRTISKVPMQVFGSSHPTPRTGQAVPFKKCLNLPGIATSNHNSFKISTCKSAPKWRPTVAKFSGFNSSFHPSPSFSDVVSNGAASFEKVPNNLEPGPIMQGKVLVAPTTKPEFINVKTVPILPAQSQRPPPTIMSAEIDAAVQFLSCLLSKSRRVVDIGKFRVALTNAMIKHYSGHWYPTEPLKGSGYRCIRVNGVIHPLLTEAASICKLPVKEMRQAFPCELTIWVDPGDVSVRFGEEGGISVLYSKLAVLGEPTVMRPPRLPFLAFHGSQYPALRPCVTFQSPCHPASAQSATMKATAPQVLPWIPSYRFRPENGHQLNIEAMEFQAIQAEEQANTRLKRLSVRSVADLDLCQRRFSAKICLDHGYFSSIFWQNKAEIISYCLAFWTSGLCVALLGPTSWDLGCQTSTNLRSMTWIFFVQTLFILLGTLTGGILLNNCNLEPSILIFVNLVMITATLILVAFCQSASTLALTLALMGFNMGLIDTIATVSFIRRFKMDVSPFLQALYFSYGVGACFSPIVLRFFLMNIDCTGFLEQNSPKSGDWFIQNFEHDHIHRRIRQPEKPVSLEEAQKSLRLHHAFFLLAALQLPVIISAVICIIIRMTHRHETAKNDHSSNAMNEDHSETNDGVMKIWIILSAILILFISGGMEGTFSGLIFTYSKISIPLMEAQEAANIVAVFWACFALGRLSTIFATTYFSNGFILLCDVIGCLVSLCILYFTQRNIIGLYIGVAMFGLFLSNICPTTISLTEQFLDIGPITTSHLVVGAAIGEMLYPVVVGNLMYNNGPVMFLTVTFLTVIVLQIVFVLFWIMGLRIRGFSSKSAGSFLIAFSNWPDLTMSRFSYQRLGSD